MTKGGKYDRAGVEEQECKVGFKVQSREGGGEGLSGRTTGDGVCL